MANTLAEFMLLEEENEKKAVEQELFDAIKGLFIDGKVPSKKEIEEFAAEKDLDVDEVTAKIFEILSAELAEDEEEGEKEIGEPASEYQAPVDECNNGFVMPKTEPIKEEDEGEEAGEGTEEEVESEFKQDDVIKHNTSDSDSIFYGKTYKVVQTEPTDKGEFVQVQYIDDKGNSDLLWFKADEISKVEGTEGEEEEEEVKESLTESVKYDGVLGKLVGKLASLSA